MQNNTPMDYSKFMERNTAKILILQKYMYRKTEIYVKQEYRKQYINNKLDYNKNNARPD